jgi:hypothetical protein
MLLFQNASIFIQIFGLTKISEIQQLEMNLIFQFQLIIVLKKVNRLCGYDTSNGRINF